jgi:hypothetical protein
MMQLKKIDRAVVEALNVKVAQNRRTEEFHRPDHKDFMTTRELIDAKHSGYRANSISNAMEIWVLGEIRATITPDDVNRDPEAISKAYAKVFGLEKVLPDTPEARAFGSARDKNEAESNIIIVK